MFIEERYLLHADPIRERIKWHTLPKLLILLQIQHPRKPQPRRPVQLVLNIDHVEYGDRRVRIIDQRDQCDNRADGQAAVVTRISQDPDIQTGDQQCKDREKRLMDHRHLYFGRHNDAPGLGRFSDLVRKLMFHAENQHFHKTAHEKMIQFLLVGQDLFLDLVQPFEQQIGHDKNNDISCHEKKRDILIDLPDKIQTEQDRWKQASDNAEPKIIQNTFSRIGTVLDLLHQPACPKLLVLRIIHLPDLAQCQQFEIQIDLVCQF